MAPQKGGRTARKAPRGGGVEMDNRGHRELVVAEAGADSGSENFDDDSDEDFSDTDDDAREDDGAGMGSKARAMAASGRKALLARAGAGDNDDEAERSDKALREKGKDGTENGLPQNRQRVLLCSSRGITFRHRHLLNDLHALLPHSRKESKVELRRDLYQLNEIAELSNCNNAVFFEVRRHTDLYMWVSKTPNGPSAKFFVQNVHTMDELRLTGNCLKGSRPILSFDATFDTLPHLRLLKELFTQVFATPRTSRKVKPFVDHVLSFHIADGKVWFRCYQIAEKPAPVPPGQDPVGLVEVGPRFVLDLVRIFDGSFCGATLYENPEFVTPAQVRRTLSANAGHRYANRKAAEEMHQDKLAAVAGVGDDQEDLIDAFS